MTRTSIPLAFCVVGLLTPALAETARERAVAAIEAAGCVVDSSNVNDVLSGLGLSDAEFRAVGEELVAEGLADVSRRGVFRLTTPNCTAAEGTPTERTVAAIEAAGCIVDRSNINEILDGLGLADEEFREIGEALMAEGRAELSDPATFRLTTAGCP